MVRTYFLYSFLLVLAVFLGGCKGTRQADQSSVTQKEAGETIFLTFLIRDDTTSGNRITLISKSSVSGRPKIEPENSTHTNRILINQLDAGLSKVSFVAVDHPLIFRAELPNVQHELQSKIAQLKQAEFFVRITLLPETEYIRAEEERNGKIIYVTQFNVRN